MGSVGDFAEIHRVKKENVVFTWRGGGGLDVT